MCLDGAEACEPDEVQALLQASDGAAWEQVFRVLPPYEAAEAVGVALVSEKGEGRKEGEVAAEVWPLHNRETWRQKFRQ